MEKLIVSSLFGGPKKQEPLIKRPSVKDKSQKPQIATKVEEAKVDSRKEFAPTSAPIVDPFIRPAYETKRDQNAPIVKK